MFVPVACSQCTKPFQVPEAAIGKPTACPWCQATVLALPVGTPATATAPVPAAKTATAKTEPLSLDDAPAVPPRQPSATAPAARPQPRNRSRLVAGLLLGVFVLLLATGITVAVKGQNHGHGLNWEWQPFVAPDQSCQLDLPGKAKEEQDAGAGEKRFTAEGWYSGVTAWVGWRDLTQIQVQVAGAKDGWMEFERVFAPERERLKNQFGGVVTKQATTFQDRIVHEVRLDYPGGGKAIERMMVMPNGPRPRVYFVGIAGKINLDDPEIQRVFDSFRVSE